jgi:hypothetical protein
MIQKDASRNSTQSVIKISPYKQKYEESYGYFPGMPAVRPLELRIRRMCVAARWVVELYLENRCRSRPKNELYRRVSTSATICARNNGLNYFFDKVMVPLPTCVYLLINCVYLSNNLI